MENELISLFSNKYNYTFDKYIDNEEIIYLFYLDERMKKRHLKLGYNLNAEGKGCVGFELKAVDFIGRSKIIEMNGYIVPSGSYGEGEASFI